MRILTSIPRMLRTVLPDMRPMVRDDLGEWMSPYSWLSKRGITVQSPVHPNEDWIGTVLYPPGTFAYRILNIENGADR